MEKQKNIDKLIFEGEYLNDKKNGKSPKLILKLVIMKKN